MATRSGTKPTKRRTKTATAKTGASGSALRFHVVPTPAGPPWPEPWRAQVGPLLEQALDDGPEGLALLSCFEIHDERGHVYDLTLFADEDGAVYRRGTTEHVASFSQGRATGATVPKDTTLFDALNRAREEWLRAPRTSDEASRRSRATSGASLQAPRDAGDAGRVGGADPLPRWATTYDRVVLGARLAPKLRTARVQVEAPPSAAERSALRAWLVDRAPSVILEIAARVPLEMLADLEGVRFVVLGPGRRDWRGLSLLPRSVRRLSIRSAPEVTLDDLPADHPLSSLDLTIPRVGRGAPALANLETLAWTGAEELAWVSRLPRLRELALRKSRVASLPASASVERLLAFAPSGLPSLVGIAALPRLRYLRIDDPTGMARLGDLSGCVSLETIQLCAAHRIADLSDLVGAPALRFLGAARTQLDAKPFEALKGRLAGAALQLKTPTQSKAIAAHLGVPFVKTLELEGHLFDER